MSQPKINRMDNDSAYWAVLSKSSSGGDTGAIDEGHFCAKDANFDFNNSNKIPPGKTDSNRMFIQTQNGDYRIWAGENSDGSYTVTIKGYQDGVFTNPVGEPVSASSGQKLSLEIASDGTPSVRAQD